MNSARVYGNTYPVKDLLKSECKARWNAAEKAWYVPQNMLLIAMAIVERGCTADQFNGRA
jgi:hypothetical protein